MWKAVGVSVLCCCWQCVWAEAGTLAVLVLAQTLDILLLMQSLGGEGPRRNMV